ncbi:VanZ family protein [Streptomyces glaucescens]|uniref:VanZ family protein n=1 Tax=Streptomyces glaucescens TaxID=1907 RepID=UPI000A39601E|nr:VanZ family protein [Streptomyces glaucescens]
MNANLTIEPTYVLGPALVVFLGVAAVRLRRARPGWTGWHVFLRTAACLYTAAVLSITVLPLRVTWGEYANQMPWWNQVNYVPMVTVDVTAVPNILMFVPLGMLLPLLTRVSGPARAVGVSALASLCIEVTQLLSYVLFHNGRSVDVNDLLANTLGGLIGYLLVRLALARPPVRELLRRFALPRSAEGQPAVTTTAA